MGVHQGSCAETLKKPRRQECMISSGESAEQRLGSLHQRGNPERRPTHPWKRAPTPSRQLWRRSTHTDEEGGELQCVESRGQRKHSGLSVWGTFAQIKTTALNIKRRKSRAAGPSWEVFSLCKNSPSLPLKGSWAWAILICEKHHWVAGVSILCSIWW